jgi:hypothetical protein
VNVEIRDAVEGDAEALSPLMFPNAALEVARRDEARARSSRESKRARSLDPARWLA